MYKNESDKRLVELTLCGDGLAFEELVIRHEKTVLGTAYKITHDHSDVLRPLPSNEMAQSDVIFAHYAVRRNITHVVNFTAEGNITCPQGQTSFKKA